MAKKNRKAGAKKGNASLCDRMKEAAGQVAREHGFLIMDMRCSMMSAMFVPNRKPERRAAFSFTIAGKDAKK